MRTIPTVGQCVRLTRIPTNARGGAWDWLLGCVGKVEEIDVEESELNISVTLKAWPSGLWCDKEDLALVEEGATDWVYPSHENAQGVL